MDLSTTSRKDLTDKDALAARAPILVTGMHRSGTTWVGRMLALAGGVVYLSEPLNPYSPGPFISLRARQQYCYISRRNEESFLNAYQLLTNLEYPFSREFQAIRTGRDVFRVGRRALRFRRARKLEARPLVKDPFALFSIPWFIERFNYLPIVVVRHPAAVVGSLKRLGWRFDFGQLLDQPLLMEAALEPYESEMERLRRSPSDIITHGSVLWKIIYTTVDKLRREHKLYAMRHEDLSFDPMNGFSDLYKIIGIQFTDKVVNQIHDYTDSRNPSELKMNRPNEFRLDSRANITNWKGRLSSSDIERVRQLTEGVAELFYPDFEDPLAAPDRLNPI
jgi:hypothetical protein